MCQFLTEAVEDNKFQLMNYRAFDTLVDQSIKNRKLFQGAEAQVAQKKMRRMVAKACASLSLRRLTDVM